VIRPTLQKQNFDFQAGPIASLGPDGIERATAGRKVDRVASSAALTSSLRPIEAHQQQAAASRGVFVVPKRSLRTALMVKLSMISIQPATNAAA